MRYITLKKNSSIARIVGHKYLYVEKSTRHPRESEEFVMFFWRRKYKGIEYGCALQVKKPDKYKTVEGFLRYNYLDDVIKVLERDMAWVLFKKRI